LKKYDASPLAPTYIGRLPNDVLATTELNVDDAETEEPFIRPAI